MMRRGILGMAFIVGCTGSEADESMLPAIADPPKVPALGLAPPATPKAADPAAPQLPAQPPPQTLGPPTGAVLAEWDMVSNADFVPLGVGVTWGPGEDGAPAALWKEASGNAGFCTPFVELSGDVRVDATLELSRIVDAGPGQSGLTIEVRAFDATRNILPAPLGTRVLAVFQIPTLSGPTAWTYARPEGAQLLRVCVRIDRATADAAVHRLMVSAL